MDVILNPIFKAGDKTFKQLNNNKQFDPGKIYGDEFVVKKESRIPGKATSFLDLDIRILNGEFKYKLFGKTRTFKVPIQKYIHGKSCVTKKTYLAVMKSQCKRITDACLEKKEKKANLWRLRLEFRKRKWSIGTEFYELMDEYCETKDKDKKRGK